MARKKADPKALYSTHEGELIIGDIVIPCAVLEDETRVLTTAGVLRALGRSHGRARGGLALDGDQLPGFLRGKAIKPYISDELATATTPMRFTPKRGGLYPGFKAETLPMICDVFLEARKDGVLPYNQVDIAKRCEILVRGFAKVGIIALVDEATGYQYFRSRQALEIILREFISKELYKWVKTFPDEFYKEMYRLRNWKYSSNSVARPAIIGKYTNDIVYERLAPGVLAELKRMTPRDSKGRTKHRYFQRLTEDIGHPRLREHLTAVIALMKVFPTWGEFYRAVQIALPKHGENLQLMLPEPKR